MVAEVIINRGAKKLNRTFDYNIPKELEELILVGSKVLVPFGNGGKLTEAFVVGIKETSAFEVKDIAKLEESFRTKNIPKTLKILEKYLDIQDIFKDFERNKLKKLQSLLKHLEQIFTQDLDNKNIRDVIGNANQNLLLIDGIDVIEQFKYPNTNDENYFDAVYKHVDELTYACAKKIVLELFSDNSRYMTVHKSKGREFDSVLVNLGPFSSRTSSEKDFKPEEIFTSQKAIIENNPTYEEYLRIAYVACSRAINKLYIHLHGDESIALKIKKTLDTYYNVENNICPFYEFVYC